MTNQITLDTKNFEFDESFLPCIITGACKSGASYFSISLIANLIKNGSKIIFFTAFEMAKEELFNQIGRSQTFEITNKSDIDRLPQNKTIIVKSGDKELWEEVIQNIKHIEEYVIFVKNFEHYDNSILNILGKRKKVLLSGSLDNCSFKKQLSIKRWKSKIIFTIPNIDLHVQIPNLEKYESYLIGKNKKGILRIK